MPLASGADVKIGSYEFVLDDSVDDPYIHLYESLYSDTQQIQGLDAVTANPNVLVWAYDDFAGGGEQKYYDLNLPDTYWYGKANPRIRGALNPAPATAVNTANTTSVQATKAFFVNVAGKSWLFADRQCFYSTDGATWSAHGGNPIFGAGYTIDGATHDGNNPWVCASDGSTRKVLKVTSTSATTTAVNDVTSGARTYGMAMLEGKVYLWTGGSLLEYNSVLTLPITHSNATNRVHTPADEITTASYAGIAASEASLFYFISSAGTTHVYEYKFNGSTNTFIGRPVWNPPAGFTCRQIAFSMGVLYLLGDYGNQVALMGMSTIVREPLFLSYVGQQYGGGSITLTPRYLSASYGAQVILGIDDGTTNYHFVYDAELDALSELDEVAVSTDSTVLAGTTFTNRRLSASAGSTTMRIRRWVPDYDTPTASEGFGWVSSAWNLGYPYDEKLLFGFQIVQDPAQASGTVQVEYQIDESGTWVSAGTTSAGVKYTYLDIASSNVKFRNLRVRLTGASGARLLSWTARAYVNSYQELWKLTLKLKPEAANRDGRPSFRQVPADVLANYLNTLVTDRNSVVFLDGRRHRAQSGTSGTGYETHRVVVEFPRGQSGIIVHRGKGQLPATAEIILRSTNA